MEAARGALLSSDRRGKTCFSSLSGKEERGPSMPAEGEEKKSNKLVQASEQEKGTRDTSGVKFY